MERLENDKPPDDDTNMEMEEINEEKVTRSSNIGENEEKT